MSLLNQATLNCTCMIYLDRECPSYSVLISWLTIQLNKFINLFNPLKAYLYKIRLFNKILIKIPTKPMQLLIKPGQNNNKEEIPNIIRQMLFQ